MTIVSVERDNYEDLINQACAILNQGGIIIYPTETFYGIGAKYDSKEALQRVLKIKNRPNEKTFPLIIGDREQLDKIAECSPIERLIIDKCWPGALTILLRSKISLPSLIQWEGRIAVRLSSSVIARDISTGVQCPITATSANLSSMPPAQDAKEAYSYFQEAVDLIIDNGRTPGGLPSTIIAVHQGMIEVVRRGAFDLQSLYSFLQLPVYYR